MATIMLFHLPVLPRPALLLQRHGTFSPAPSQPRKAFYAARCCHGWECQGVLGWDKDKANRASASGKNGDDDESSQELWISAPALGAAAVCILAYRCVPWGLRILGFVPVIAIFVVRLKSASLLEKVRSGLRMLGEEMSSVDRSMEGFFSGEDTKRKRRKKQGVSLDLPAIHGCLYEMEGVLSSMKQKDIEKTKDDIHQLEQVLESLKQLVLLDAASSKTSENAEEKIKVNTGDFGSKSDDPAVCTRSIIPDSSSSMSTSVEDSNTQTPEALTSNVGLAEKEEVPVTKVPASTTEEGFEDDHAFNLKLQEAEALIREGRGLEKMEAADNMLDDAVRVLQTAVTMKPNNLVAVGMLANALLVYGQVKLKAAHELKSIGPNSDIASERLREICQGCEDLLVEAGRTYRRALFIDRKDVRALHNWGVALCSRAELLSLGEGTSWQEVEKVYLAAIDKFEALVGLGQDHAAPALLHWALAVRSRARLRDRGSKDRINLLLQAQQLLLDAAVLDPKDEQIKVEACCCQEEIEELERLHL